MSHGPNPRLSKAARCRFSYAERSRRSGIVSLSLGIATLFLTGCATSIHDEAAAGNLDKVTAMLQENPACLEARNPLGKTPLFYAVTNRRTEMVDFLLSRGADVHAADNTGLTPLHIAAWWDCRDQAVQLIEHGADVNARDAFGDTPLHVAAFQDRTSMIDLLVGRGARLDARNTAGMTPLASARANRKEKAAARLHELGAGTP